MAGTQAQTEREGGMFQSGAESSGYIWLMVGINPVIMIFCTKGSQKVPNFLINTLSACLTADDDWIRD